MPEVEVLPLTEEQIQKLPYPETARLIGGLLIIKENPLEHHLNVEEFRRVWNKMIKESK